MYHAPANRLCIHRHHISPGRPDIQATILSFPERPYAQTSVDCGGSCMRLTEQIQGVSSGMHVYDSLACAAHSDAMSYSHLQARSAPLNYAVETQPHQTRAQIGCSGW